MSEPKTKRRRLVLSCFECKRRKLKCGRETPICMRCINVGNPELCKYDPRYLMGTENNGDDLAGTDQVWSPTNSISQVPTTTFDNFDPSLIGDNWQATSWLPFQLDLDLESASSEILDSESLIESLQSRMVQQPVADRRKSLNGRFRGPSHSTSSIASFQNLYKFMNQTLQDHHILGAPQWAAYIPNTEQPLPSYSKAEVEPAMKRLLLSQERCRRLSTSYFDHFTEIYTLFHVPSFWNEFQNYWDGTHQDPIRFNAVLLALMACARCLFADSPLSFEGDSSTARNEAVAWLHAVEAWQSYQQARSTMDAFQIRTLVLFSKTLNHIDREENYTASQTLLADAISNGLHRDWILLGIEESIHERDLRYKIWSAIAELDVAACIERGVPSMVSNLFTDIGQPKSHNDCDNPSSTEFESLDKPDIQLTHTSFIKFADSIRPLRHDVNDFVNNAQKRRSLDNSNLEAMRAQIYEALDRIAKWSDPVPDKLGRNQGRVYRAVLELYLHELLLLLHLPFAITRDTSDSSGGETEFQRFICVRSACTIIKIYELVSTEGFSPIALGNANLIRAGLCLSLLEEGTSNYGITSLPICPSVKTKLVKSALSMVEQHVLSLGTDLQSFWLLSAASCYFESRGDPNTNSASKSQITDNIVALFSKMCWAQKQKSVGFGLSDTHFARYLLEIYKACEAKG